MKIWNETKITVVGKAEPTTSQDGKNTYYRVAVMQNGQATNLMVSKEVYESIPDGLVEVKFRTAFDDRYTSFRVEDLIEIISVNGRPFEKASAAGTAPEKTGGK